MKKKNLILAVIFMLGGALGAYAQSATPHADAHARMQARNVSAIERAAANEAMSQEILKQETSKISKESEKMIEDLIKEANKHIGKPYVWGATGPKGFDCSGFTSYVYKQFGVPIQRTSRNQYSTDGEHVKKEDLRKGDLVFFTSPRNGHKGVGHVGIVHSVDPGTGAIKFIHAGRKGIAVQDFNANYQKRYVGAKRLIKQ